MLDKVQELAGPLIVNGYRQLAKANNCAPTEKTSDQKIIEIYKKVVLLFEKHQIKGMNIFPLVI